MIPAEVGLAYCNKLFFWKSCDIRKNIKNHCLFKAKDIKGAVDNTVDYSSLTIY